MLNFRRLRTDFAPNAIKEGKSLWEEKKVVSAQVKDLTSSTIQILSQVEGKFNHIYKQQIEIDRNESCMLDSSCNCSLGFDCQHIASVTFYLEECLESLVVSYSQKGEVLKSDDVKECAKILDTIKEAEALKSVKQARKYDKELLEEYNKASSLLSQAPFFLPEDQIDQDSAELSILFQLPEKKFDGFAIDFQLALRLPYRTKPLLIQNIKEFLDAVRYQEPLWIQHKRYFLPTSSFDKESAEILSILLTYARPKEANNDPKLERLGIIEMEAFATLLSTSFDLASQKLKGVIQKENSNEHPLPCLYGQTFDEPLYFCPIFAKIKFDIQLVQIPLNALLLEPHIVLGLNVLTLEQVMLLDCAKPGLLKERTYYRFQEIIRRKHLKSLEPIRNMAIPEPLFGAFVENSMSELTRFAEVSNKAVLDQFVTLPFTGKLGGVCNVNYLDGELEASIDFVYDQIKVPFAKSQIKVDMIRPFVSQEGILARNLVEEQKIIDDLFQDFAYDPKSGFFKVKSDKKIVEFMTETIPRYQKEILFHCPENLLDQFVYDDTHFKLMLKETEQIDAYQVNLEVKGPLKGATVDQLWDCITSKRSFLELPLEKGKKKGNQPTKFLVLNLEKLSPVVQIFDEIGINSLDTHKENRPLWSLVTISPDQFENIPVSFKMSDKLIELQQQMLGTKHYDALPVPVEIQATPRIYQVEGVSWLERLRFMHLNGILADDMGLGKTLQAIIAVTQFHKENSEAKSIVVCPTSLIYNWKEEIERFNPLLKVLTVDGTPVQRKKLINHLGSYDIVVTSYSLLQKDVECYEKIPFGYAILDEAQHIKNRTTRNAKSVKALNARHRLILTGTPVENSLDELWSLFDFLMPGLLSSYDRFVEKYIRVPRQSHKECMEALKRKVSPFVLRRMKKDVLAELPPVSEMVYFCNLTETQKDLYKSYALSAREELSQLVQKEGFDRVQIHVLATLTRLKQICCHPAIFAKEHIEEGDSAKYDMLMDLLDTLLLGNHKTVIFSQYTRMLQIMRDELKRRNIGFCYLDGTSKNRMSIVKQFNENEEIPVFLVSLKAGGSGLNLTGADTVIHYDMWWNPAVESQATDRVHRMGQKKSVSSYKLVTKGTIEEKIIEMQKRKTGLVKQVISTDDEAMSKLTWEEVLELLQT